MISSSQERPKQSSRFVPTSAAALAHGALLLILLHGSGIAIAPMRLPGTAEGTHMSLTYLPGRPSPPATMASAARLPPRRRVTPAPVPQPETRSPLLSNTAVASTSQAAGTQGNDALGTGDVNIALATSFPTPKPDLSSLPHGTSGDVVLDIVIDAAGKVSSITMSRGLGHGIDETVIAAVGSWSFHPATRDGRPVPSEQELHFHYEKA